MGSFSGPKRPGVWTCKALGREGPGALFESDPL